MLLRDIKTHNEREKVQHAQSVQMDGQKRIRRHQHHWQKQPKLRQRKNCNEQSNADDGQIPKLAQPERGFGIQVIGVNVNTITSVNKKRAAAGFFCGGAGWLFFCLRLRRF